MTAPFGPHSLLGPQAPEAPRASTLATPATLGKETALAWGALFVACALGPTPLAVAWVIVGALGALPALGRAPADALYVLHGLYLGLMGTLALAMLSGVGLADGDALLVWLGALGIAMTLGLGVICAWVVISLLLATAPPDEWPVEVGRVGTMALLPGLPLAGVGASVSAQLSVGANGAASTLGLGLGAGSWPGLWVGPELAGALTGLGVCALGALVVRRACAESPSA